MSAPQVQVVQEEVVSRRFDLEKKVPRTNPATGRKLTSKQYKQAIVKQFRSDNKTLTSAVSNFFRAYINTKSGQSFDVMPKMRNTPGVQGDQLYIDRPHLRSLIATALFHLKREPQFFAAALSRRTGGGGSAAFAAPLIVRDDMLKFLQEADQAGIFNGDARQYLTFLNPAEPDYRLTTKGILSTLLDIYRLKGGDRGEGLGTVPGKGKSLLIADARMRNNFARYFEQIAADQRARMPPGARLGEWKDPSLIGARTANGKKARKEKVTDRYRLDSLDEFFQNTLRSSLISKGTYSSKTAAQAQTSGSAEEQDAFRRLMDVATTPMPKMEEDERKAYRDYFAGYAKFADAEKKKTKSATFVPFDANAAIATVTGNLGRQSRAVEARARRDAATIAVRNAYGLVKQQVAAQTPGATVMSPTAYWRQHGVNSRGAQ